jgi:RNA polymerase sigma factor (sigma-70 family)
MKYMQFSHQSSDAELISAFVSGTEEALPILIARYKDKLYTSIYMLVKDKYLAEDLFQDAFLKIIRTMREGNYSEQGKFLPWAMRVSHNLCMDYFRRTRRKIPVTLPNGDDIMELFAGLEDNCEVHMERRQSQQSIRALIGQLPEEQREVIALRVYGELSFKEIAEITSVSINTALGRMRYALINLRRMITEKKMALR